MTETQKGSHGEYMGDLGVAYLVGPIWFWKLAFIALKLRKRIETQTQEVKNLVSDRENRIEWK